MSDIAYTTKVVTYKSERAMKRGIKRMERDGWEVVSTQAIERGRKASQWCLFGLFALLFKQQLHYQVTFRKMK